MKTSAFMFIFMAIAPLTHAQEVEKNILEQVRGSGKNQKIVRYFTAQCLSRNEAKECIEMKYFHYELEDLEDPSSKEFRRMCMAYDRTKAEINAHLEMIKSGQNDEAKDTKRIHAKLGPSSQSLASLLIKKTASQIERLAESPEASVTSSHLVSFKVWFKLMTDTFQNESQIDFSGNQDCL